MSDPLRKPENIRGIDYKVLAHVDRESGYQGTIYQRLDTKEIIVAHRGSEFDEQFVKDGILADGGMMAKRVNSQAADAIEFTRFAVDIARTYAEHHGWEPKVTVTGHSLGGCLTQITAAKFNLHGETFNPYGAASLAYGIPEGGSQVINHVMAGDVVSAAGKHFGQIRMYAEPVELNVMKAAGYQDDGSRFDLRNPLKAAVIGGDSHRMHHFLEVDGKDRPDRSILGDSRARELAERHRPMFEKYRGDIENLREGVSIGAAISRGSRGIADEIGRRWPGKADSPFKDADGLNPLNEDAEKRNRDPRTPAHPDHALYLQIRNGVSTLHEREARAYHEVGERTAAGLLVAAKAGGLRRVDHVVSGRSAQGEVNVFAVQGEIHDPAHQRAQVALAEVARTPVTESFHRLEQVNALAATQATQGLAQEPARSAHGRSV